MTNWLLLLLVVLLVAASAVAAAAATTEECSSSTWLDDCNPDDRVRHLPGYDAPLPSPWYSGYLHYQLENNTIHTHYTLVLQEELNDKDSDFSSQPLIYWSNGGPGASSLFGLLTELGPLLLSDESKATDAYRETGIPTPIYNPYAWSRLGSLLIFDQPAPVGFSYCNDDDEKQQDTNVTINNCGDISWTDELASLNAFLALQAFYEKFPCLRARKLYLTGESYGGIYIPTLARRIVQFNDVPEVKNTTGAAIKLAGFAVGDGCLGTQTGICSDLSDNDPGFGDVEWHALFLAGHGQIPLSTYRQVMETCYHPKPGHPHADIMDETDPSSWLRRERPAEETKAAKKTLQKSPACQAAIDKMLEQAGGYYEYSLYDDCTYENGLLLQRQQQQELGAAVLPNDEVGMKVYLQQLHKRYHSTRKPAAVDVSAGAVNDFPCGGPVVMPEYLQLAAVKQALHVPKGVSFFEVDNAAGGFRYTPTEPDLTPFYQKLVAKNRKQQLRNDGGGCCPMEDDTRTIEHCDCEGEGIIRMLIYNGDTDPSITSFAAQNWTSSLGFEVLNKEWRPWTLDQCQRVGGYVTRYQGQFDFLTIRGAGHMVPTYKPAATFAFMSAWIHHQEYPVYNQTCLLPPLTPPTELQQKHEASNKKDEIVTTTAAEAVAESTATK